MATKKEVKRIVKQMSLKDAKAIISGGSIDVEEVTAAYVVLKKAMEVYESAVETAEAVITDLKNYDLTFGSLDPVIIECNGEAVKLIPGKKTSFVVDKDALTYSDLPSGIVKTEIKLDHKLLRKAYEDGCTDGGIASACSVEEKPTITVRSVAASTELPVSASIVAPKED